VIVNLGLTVAYDVRVRFVQELKTTLDVDGLPLGESKLLTEGIATLPPSTPAVVRDLAVWRSRT
jgi:hypothetical protein